MGEGTKVQCKEAIMGRTVELFTKDQEYKVTYQSDSQTIVRDNLNCMQAFYDKKLFNKHFEYMEDKKDA